MEGLRAAQWQSPRFGRLILQWCGGRTCQKMPASGLGSWRGEARGRHLAPYRFSWERGGGGGGTGLGSGPLAPLLPGRPAGLGLEQLFPPSAPLLAPAAAALPEESLQNIPASRRRLPRPLPWQAMKEGASTRGSARAFVLAPATAGPTAHCFPSY